MLLETIVSAFRIWNTLGISFRMDIDVVIPSYNFNKELIDRIEKIQIPKEVIVKCFIVIDNLSLIHI